MRRGTPKNPRRAATVRHVLRHLRPHLSLVLLSLLCAIGTVALTLYVPLLFGRAIDEGGVVLFHPDGGTSAAHIPGKRGYLAYGDHRHRFFSCRFCRLFKVELAAARNHKYAYLSR